MSFESLVVTVLVRITANLVLVLARILMHDRYQPVHVAWAVRQRQGTST